MYGSPGSTLNLTYRTIFTFQPQPKHAMQSTCTSRPHSSILDDTVRYTKRQREATYGSVVVQVAPYRMAGTQAEPGASPEATAAVAVVVHC